MADPTTGNVVLFVPARGADPGTWDVPVNSNSTALDGYLGGVQTIAVSNASFALTAPAGVVTAGAGPNQSQNAVLSFTGTLTAPVQITLPLPGFYIVENLTSGNFVLSFKALGSGQVIAIDQGESVHIYNNGTNVRFVNFGRIGHLEIWAGLSALPAWIAACTVPPYILCDGSIYNFSTYPYLGARLLGAFGGNGITTFGVPDLRGRMAIPYDGTGTRITTAGSGLNGQTLGAALDAQTITLTSPNLPPYTPAGTIAGTAGATNGKDVVTSILGFSSINAVGGGSALFNSASDPTQVPTLTVTATFAGTAAPGQISTPINNVQPSQVTGIAVIRAA